MTPASTPSVCPSCGAAADGRFCSSCGTALAGASCAACGTSLSTGARFCHRCGTPSGASSTLGSRRMDAALPWTVAAIAFVALIALVVSQRFATRPSGTTDVLDGANAQGSTVISAPAVGGERGMPRAPDISQLTPTQRAERLYDRIMMEHEAGRDDAVRAFVPMAIAAYELLGPLTLDQRYDVGRIGEVAGDIPLARAQSDTILQERRTHLLGLILGASAARLSGDSARARALSSRLIAAERAERAAPLPEYLIHQRDIETALATAKLSGKP